MDATFVSYAEALHRTLSTISPLSAEEVPLLQLTGRVVAFEVRSLVDAPSTDVSLKDGFAVRGADIAEARLRPVTLRLLGGAAVAGQAFAGEVLPGTAVRILSGARVPAGADAVISEEFARVEGEAVTVSKDASPGRNILRRGADVAAGELLLSAGTVLRPAQVGLLAAAGYDRLRVVRRPVVSIIATGDEIVLPGGELGEGQCYASNMVTMAAWCAHYGLETRMAAAADNVGSLEHFLQEAISASDAIVTSGGAWRGERDLVASTLIRLGWQKQYHHVRLGPGKAVGFGLWHGKPVFCLPGGPPSAQMAFLQLALPGLLRLAGRRQPGLPVVPATLDEDMSGEIGWTQVVEGLLSGGSEGMRFRPHKRTSRLQSMAGAQGFAMIPEGVGTVAAGTAVPVQVLPEALGVAGWAESAEAETRATARTVGRTARSPVPVVSFVARSGVGKTTFLERLIPELAGRGLQVGVLKHHAHPTPFDVPGKDTYRLAQAGAGVVVGACSVQVAVFYQEDGSADLEAVIERHLSGVDLVLTEGFKRGSYPKVEVHRHARHPELLCEPGELLALVSDRSFDYAVPQFNLDDAAGLADFLLDWLRRD